MSSHITLLGTEEVQKAASTMRSAANEMQSAVGNLDGALERHRRWADGWLERLQAILEAHTLHEVERK